jgi:pimeloyl-ACP methyl ester carboxylesterase
MFTIVPLVTCLFVQPPVAEPAPPVRREIVVPLRDGKWLHVRDFVAAANKSLNMVTPTEWIDDAARIPIDNNVRWSIWGLQVAGAVELGTFEFRDKSLIVRVPTGHEARRRFRELAKLVGVPIPDWPANKRGIVLPDGFDPDRPAILFVHGLGASCDATFARFKTLAADAGIQTLFFDYPNIGPLDSSAKRLRDELTALERKHPKLRLTIVAHSMGGLVVRDALERTGESLHPGDVFLIGTPSKGSRVAEMYPAMWAVERALAPKEWKAVLAEGLGEAAIDLEPGSDFLAALGKRPMPKSMRYHIVVGDRAFIGPTTRRQVLAPLVKQAADKLPAEVKARVLRTLETMDEIVHELGDGCVTLKSARLDGAASTRTLPLNHLDLPQSREVWEHIVKTIRDR